MLRFKIHYCTLSEQNENAKKLYISIYLFIYFYFARFDQNYNQFIFQAIVVILQRNFMLQICALTYVVDIYDPNL